MAELRGTVNPVHKKRRGFESLLSHKILFMFENCKNSNKQGDVGMCYAMAYFAKQGYTISIPITDSQDYDLIVDDGIKLYKVQVKTTKQLAPSNYYIVYLRTCGGNRSGQTIKHFNDNNSDYLFVLTEKHEAFLIPKNEINVNTALTLNEDVEKYKVII